MRAGRRRSGRDGGTASPGGEGGSQPPCASRNRARSCQAFVGLSRTLNVFLINRLSVSKPPRGVYNLAIKWERGISLLPAVPENIRWGLEVGGGGRIESRPAAPPGKQGLNQPLAWDYLERR